MGLYRFDCRASWPNTPTTSAVKFELHSTDHRVFPQAPVAHCIRKRDALSDEIEIKCEACDGTGVQIVKQPTEPSKRIYPARCKICGGKGRLKKAVN